MSRYRLGDLPPSCLKTLRDKADQNVIEVLAAWGNPELSKEDMDTLKLVSMILITMTPGRLD
jgi:hypothetical protein